jgi:hypothetical protein
VTGGNKDKLSPDLIGRFRGGAVNIDTKLMKIPALAMKLSVVNKSDSVPCTMRISTLTLRRRFPRIM